MAYRKKRRIIRRRIRKTYAKRKRRVGPVRGRRIRVGYRM